MKTGAENKKVLVVTIILAALALVMVVRMFLALNAAPAVASANPAQTAQSARRIPKGAQPKLTTANSLDPTLKLDVLKATEATEYKGSGRNIFAAYTPPVHIDKPVTPVVTELTMQCPGSPRCPPPPIPLKFYGFASKPGEAKRVFLSSSTGDVFIAAEGEVVNRRYRVLHIGVNSVEIEDVLQNNRQTIPLTQG
ncbi:MAG: hypothetical protein HYX28_00360 [Candidatus Koribacter versatilis]|uniref:Uncharacterized protein n=1 Tax=Candidatus Korobacter versatilis TaxID=658062 RepID=A0A932A805_9BACT|nr:hypothetical protein [Candidatus Koribacter versatilis]